MNHPQVITILMGAMFTSSTRTRRGGSCLRDPLSHHFTTSLPHHFPSSPPCVIASYSFVMYCYVMYHPSSMSSLTILFVRNTEVLLPNFLWPSQDLWHWVAHILQIPWLPDCVSVCFSCAVKALCWAALSLPGVGGYPNKRTPLISSVFKPSLGQAKGSFFRHWHLHTTCQFSKWLIAAETIRIPTIPMTGSWDGALTQHSKLSGTSHCHCSLLGVTTAGKCNWKPSIGRSCCHGCEFKALETQQEYIWRTMSMPTKGMVCAKKTPSHDHGLLFPQSHWIRSGTLITLSYTTLRK